MSRLCTIDNQCRHAIRLRQLEQKYQELQKNNRALNTVIKTQSKLIEKLLLRIEELERMVFGKKKRNEPTSCDGHTGNQDPSAGSARSSLNRAHSSYRRLVPNEEDVTRTERHPLTSCPDCGHRLSDLKTILRYVEDVLPLSEWHTVLKRITKHLITTGYCRSCRKRTSAVPISAHAVTIGDNVKPLVSFGTVILRLSYSQIQDFFAGILRFQLSDGEISNLLSDQAIALLPQMQRFMDTIRSQSGSHYDETSWSVQTRPSNHQPISPLRPPRRAGLPRLTAVKAGEADRPASAGGEASHSCNEARGNYAWVMTGTETPEAVFLLGRSRGMENALELRGETNAETKGITDDYPAYQNLFDEHQLCWAHPNRKLRDLAESTNLPAPIRAHCQQAYQSFSALYQTVREIAASPFVLAEREKIRLTIGRRLIRFSRPHPSDPEKLRRIKERLRERNECYLTCITIPGIPPDNNKAERSLRHLVLKRKVSFGSKTSRGADVMSVLYSVLLSWWWTSKETFFQKYAFAIDSS